MKLLPGASLVLAGAIAWHQLRHRYIELRDQPRETPHERAQRRARCHTYNALELLEVDLVRPARRAALKAHRIDAGNPDNLLTLARIEARAFRYELARQYFDAARQAHDDGRRSNHEFLAVLSRDAAINLARLRQELKDGPECESLDESILTWAGILCEEDADGFRALTQSPLLANLGPHLQMLHLSRGQAREAQP